MTATRILRAVLVRLAVVTAVLYGLALLALPDCDCHTRPAAKEGGAIASLKNIHAAERQFMAAASVDRDGDGQGEAGSFAELAGAAPLRQAADASVATKELRVPLLSKRFAQIERERVHRGRYVLQLFLPGGDGDWVTDEGEADIDASEREFCVCAWPDDHDGQVLRAFYVDASGVVWACANQDQRYVGDQKPLPPDAPLPAEAARAAEANPPASTLPGAGQEHRRGRDGQTWVRVR